VAGSFLDNDDLRFYLERGAASAALAEGSEAGYRTPDGFETADEVNPFYREVAELVGTLACRTTTGERFLARKESSADARVALVAGAE